MAGEIVRRFNGVDILVDPITRRFNLTAMCKSCGKEWSMYYKAGDFQDFLNALGRSLLLSRDQLISQKLDGPNNQRGTWGHSRVAIYLAQRLSPELAAEATGWLEELFTTGTVSIASGSVNSLKGWLPRLERYLQEHQLYVSKNFPPSSWTVVLEAIWWIFRFQDRLIEHGLPCLARDLMDASIGSCYAKWRLLEENQAWAKPLPASSHIKILTDQGKEIEVLVYPPEEKVHFHRWLKEVYHPKNLGRYMSWKFKPEKGKEETFGRQIPAVSAAHLQSLQVSGVPAIGLKLYEQDAIDRAPNGRIFVGEPLAIPAPHRKQIEASRRKCLPDNRQRTLFDSMEAGLAF